MVARQSREIAQCCCGSDRPCKASPEKAVDAIEKPDQRSLDIKRPATPLHEAADSTDVHEDGRHGQATTTNVPKGSGEAHVQSVGVKHRKREKFGGCLRKMWPGTCIVFALAGLGERIYELVECAGTL